MPTEVLVVDDDTDLRHSLAMILTPRFQVIEASNGKEALSLLSERKPALMLLDVSMPGMGGLEVLQEARAAAPTTIVVMLTSHQDTDLAIQALRLGAVEYVTKPFDADYIRDEVSRLLGPQRRGEDKPWRIAP